MKFISIKNCCVALPAIAFLSLSACNDNEPTSETEKDITSSLSTLSYNDAGIWSDNNKDEDFVLDGFRFSHYLSEYMTVEGFTPSRSTDNALHEPMYEWLYTVVPGKGIDSKPFIAAFWSSWEGETFDERSCSISRTDGKDFIPYSVMVVNSCYAYYTMILGDSYAKKFEKGDWFKLIAHGVKNDGSENVAEFYLADIKDSDNIKNGIITEWTKFDLSSLGSVSGIYFTLDSSDSSEWGMNTPASFAISNFCVAQDK